GTEQVTLVLQRTMPVVLEITPRFADGEKPESVQVMTDRTDPQVTQPGRFGDHRVQGAFDRPPVRPVAYWTTLGPEGVLRLDLVSGIAVTVTLSAFRDNANWAW